MKTITTIMLILGVAALSFAAPNEAASNENEVYLLHEGLYRVAALSLKVLRATDENDTRVAELRAEARAHLTVYSKEVDDLKTKYNWDLLKDPLVEQVRSYLKETENIPPNNRLQAIGAKARLQPEP